MDSKSASEMSPTRSTPRTKPALFTERVEVTKLLEVANPSALTKDVDVTELRGDIVEEGRNLLLVRDVEGESNELSALLQARLLVRRGTRVCNGLESICAARAEDQVRAALRVCVPSVHMVHRDRLETSLVRTLAKRMAVACGDRRKHQRRICERANEA